jgi:hypothetical protein
MIRSLCLALLTALVVPAPAQAHKASDSYLALAVTSTGVEGQWDIALRDLEQAVGLDGNGDGAIAWGELKAQHRAVASYAMPRLGLAADSAPCEKLVTEHLVDSHTDGAYAVLRFSAACATAPRQITVSYRLLADLDPLHRGLLRVVAGENTHTAVLGPDAPEFRLVVDEAPDLLSQFLGYLWQGVWHIWIGFDHILFLISLLLPAVLRRRDGRWQAVATFREAVFEVLKVVSAFTLAHSITLTLATLGILSLPSRLVESSIAASVVLAALNNVYPMFDRKLWLVALGFGLIHGLGFAGALEELGLPRHTLAVSLLAFNLGVELGQLAIVALFLPLAFLLRETVLYPRVIVGTGSVAIAAVAGIWLLERALDLELL